MCCSGYPAPNWLPGDLLRLSEGERAGADARLLQTNALRVQEASLTGESKAVLKDSRILPPGTPLAERCNMVFKGTVLAMVTATGMATEMGRIAHLLAGTPEQATPLQNQVRQIGVMLGHAVLMTTEVRTLADVEAALLLGVSLAVAAVPEGLPAILSLVLAIGVRRMASRQASVKNLSSVETLGSTSVICSDKTGALTRSEMTIASTVLFYSECRKWLARRMDVE